MLVPRPARTAGAAAKPPRGRRGSASPHRQGIGHEGHERLDRRDRAGHPRGSPPAAPVASHRHRGVGLAQDLARAETTHAMRHEHERGIVAAPHHPPAPGADDAGQASGGGAEGFGRATATRVAAHWGPPPRRAASQPPATTPYMRNPVDERAANRPWGAPIPDRPALQRRRLLERTAVENTDGPARAVGLDGAARGQPAPGSSRRPPAAHTAPRLSAAPAPGRSRASQTPSRRRWFASRRPVRPRFPRS